MSPVGLLVTQFSRGACEGDHIRPGPVCRWMRSPGRATRRSGNVGRYRGLERTSRACGSTSAVGTKRTCRLCCAMSAIGGKAENICSRRVFPLLTRNGLRRQSSAIVVYDERDERADSVATEGSLAEQGYQ